MSPAWRNLARHITVIKAPRFDRLNRLLQTAPSGGEPHVRSNCWPNVSNALTCLIKLSRKLLQRYCARKQAFSMLPQRRFRCRSTIQCRMPKRLRRAASLTNAVRLAHAGQLQLPGLDLGQQQRNRKPFSQHCRCKHAILVCCLGAAQTSALKANASHAKARLIPVGTEFFCQHTALFLIPSIHQIELEVKAVQPACFFQPRRDWATQFCNKKALGHFCAEGLCGCPQPDEVTPSRPSRSPHTLRSGQS